MVYYAKRPDLRQERETSNTVCLEFTGDVERIRKWGKGVAVCQTQSMNAPKGERDIYMRSAAGPGLRPPICRGEIEPGVAFAIVERQKHITC